MLYQIKNAPDKEIAVLGTPSGPQAAMYAKVEESGKLLCSQMAEKISKQACPDLIWPKLHRNSYFSKYRRRKHCHPPKMGEKLNRMLQKRYRRTEYPPFRWLFKVASVQSMRNGKVSDSKTILLQGCCQLPAAQRRNRAAFAKAFGASC